MSYVINVDHVKFSTITVNAISFIQQGILTHHITADTFTKILARLDRLENRCKELEEKNTQLELALQFAPQSDNYLQAKSHFETSVGLETSVDIETSVGDDTSSSEFPSK